MIILTEFRAPADELAAFEKGKPAMSTTRCNLRVILSVGLLAVCGAECAGGNSTGRLILTKKTEVCDEN